MATRQYQPESLEARRAQRRRRARRRKKRIRAVLLLILLIAVIVLVLLAFASCHNNKNGNVQSPDAADAVETTTAPTAQPAYAGDAGEDSLLPPTTENNDLLDIIMDIDAKGAEKTCYLTFDDGPSPNITPSILDTLRRYNVKATFFMLGSSINSYPDLARRVYEEGHLIANHSNGHNYETLYATEESFMTEVMATEDIISNITNGDHNFRLFRFPGGSYNAGDHAAEKQIYKRTLAANGFYHIDWNALNGDAEGRTKTAPELLGYLQTYIDNNKCAVVLMHDAAAKTATAEALGSIIEYLLSQGYTFKRLDEMPYLPPAYNDPYNTGNGTYNYDNSYDDGDDYDSDYYDDDDYDSDDDYDDDYDDYDDDYSSSSYTSSSSNNGLSGNGSIISTAPPGSTTRTSVNGTSVKENGKSKSSSS